MLLSTSELVSASSSSGVIQMSSRSVFLNEPDVTLINNIIVFSPDSSDKSGKTIFEYVVAADYADTLIAIEAVN